MNREEVKSKLNGIFCTVFEKDDIKIHDAMTAAEVEEWDSINHINLIVSVEKGFKVSFTTKEVQGLKNVGQLIDLISRRIP